MGAVALLVVSVTGANAQQKIVNGGFETGDFSGWTVDTFAGSFGEITISDFTMGPLSALPVSGPRTGAFYALSDQTGPGAYAISQTFTIGAPISSAILRFSLSPADRSGNVTVGTDFDPFSSGPNQYISADLFGGAVGGFTPAVGALRNFFQGGATTSLDDALPYTDYQFDLTGLLTPGTYTLRFAEVDNQGFFNMAVDDVSLVVTPSAVPEPSTVLLFAIGLGALGVVARHKQTRS
jgi:hypothetical protein